MRYTTYKCDECGALKRLTNHWWLLTPRLGAEGEFLVSPMPPELPDGRITVCGRECAQRAMEKWMGEVGREVAKAEALAPSAASVAESSDTSPAIELKRRGLKQVHPRPAPLSRRERQAS
jgi:hypothetical protein